MSKPRALIISNIPWDFVFQRHQSMATLLARDYSVIFLELTGTRAPRWRDAGRILRHVWGARRSNRRDGVEIPVSRLRPLVLPPTRGWMRSWNGRLLSRWIGKHPGLRAPFDLVVTYSQTRTALQLLDRIPHKRLIYDCTDDWLQVVGVSESLAAEEAELLQRADLTLVPSRSLWERKQATARRCVELPHGVWLKRFAVPDKPWQNRDRVTVLYYGHLLAQHLDFTAVHTLALARPCWRVVLVGPVKTPHRFPPNVELPGQVPHASLANWLQEADVILLPYALNDYTGAVMPAKTYEVLASGRPIVATPLPTLRDGFAAHMVFASRPDEWAGAVERALAEDSPPRRAARRAAAAPHSWEARYDDFKDLLGDAEKGCK